MNVLVDFNHPADVNFFKNAVKQLAAENHKVVLTYRHRGKLATILNFELGQFNPVCIGTHQKGFFRKVAGQLLRDLEFIQFQKKKKIDVSICLGPTNAIASTVNRIPYLAFEDDPEYKITFYHANLFATRHIMPDFIKVSKKNIFKYRGFKELAYLHPRYFQPDVKALDKYSLTPAEYVFIREIHNVSLNYKSGSSILDEVIKKVSDCGFKILLSLENKEQKEKYKNNCTILEEPVTDIYSLIKYAKFTVTSGDTVARESSLLGTPAIYTGGRAMAVNDEFIDIGILSKLENLSDIFNRIDMLAKNNLDLNKVIEHKIETEWDDVTQVIINHVKAFDK